MGFQARLYSAVPLSSWWLSMYELYPTVERMCATIGACTYELELVTIIE